MFGRKSRAAVLERELSGVGSKAADTIGELAESALTVAREATRHATPVLEKSAESLGKALERAADSLADAGEKLAKQGENRAAEAAVIARQRIADASERLAQQVRPRPKKRRWLRRILIAGAVLGGIAALLQSPLRNKISERLFGPPPEEEPDSIELPGTEPEAEDRPQAETGEQYGSPATANAQSEGNGVPSAPSGIESAQG